MKLTTNRDTLESFDSENQGELGIQISVQCYSWEVRKLMGDGVIYCNAGNTHYRQCALRQPINGSLS